MKKEELRKAIQGMNTYQFGQKKELTNKLSKITSYVAKQEVLDMVSKLDKEVEDVKPKLPAIPQFVAEFIQEIKNRKPLPIILYGALLEAKDIQELFDWIWKNGENHNAFAIAFITGKYEIKKEPTWTVKLDKGRYVDNFIESITGVEVELSHRLGCTAPIRFKDKSKAEAVALLVNGEVVEVTNNV